MRQILLSLVLFAFALTSCNGQNNDKTNNRDTTAISQTKPKTDIKVNKEYDKDGNLVRFDSTYSYYYSNIENDTILADSIFNSFRKNFNEQFNFYNDPFFNELFFQDSLIKYDFYRKDFFDKRFRYNQEHINKLFFEMDSLKNLFFNKQFKEPD